MVKQAAAGLSWGRRARELARTQLQDLIRAERRRARFHIDLIRRFEPVASSDRIAHLIVERWTKVAAVEGGITGAFGFAGVPLNFLCIVYFQLALVVSVAEAYGIELEGDAGEEALLAVVGRAHGIEDVVRASPRILASIAQRIALRHGLGVLGRIVPLAAAPISARLNERDMGRIRDEALRRFGNVVCIES